MDTVPDFLSTISAANTNPIQLSPTDNPEFAEAGNRYKLIMLATDAVTPPDLLFVMDLLPTFTGTGMQYAQPEKTNMITLTKKYVTAVGAFTVYTASDTLYSNGQLTQLAIYYVDPTGVLALFPVPAVTHITAYFQVFLNQ